MNDEFSGGYEKEMGKYGFENPSSIGIWFIHELKSD
jgi:hypothetical protein